MAISQTIMEILGVKLDVATRGAGRPILFLHSGQGLFDSEQIVERLSRMGRVIIPSHPGFGRSDLPPSVTTVDDIAYIYLQLLEALAVRDAVLIGTSFGGWIAAEVAVKSSRRLAKLVLIDSLGIKIGDRETRDIVDMHSIPDEELSQRLFVNPEKHRLDYKKLDDENAAIAARNRETFAFLGWRPYMHNPKLAKRLACIDIPTLVLWGAADGVVLPDYGRAFSALIPDSRFEIVERAGHFPHLEQPDAVAKHIADFMSSGASQAPESNMELGNTSNRPSVSA